MRKINCKKSKKRYFTINIYFIKIKNITMKYVKTFENFSYSTVNEEEEFLKALWQKFTSFISNLRDDAAKKWLKK